MCVRASSSHYQMMLVDNLIHSDLHPGNILVRLNPPKGFLGLVYRLLDLCQDSGKVCEGGRQQQGTITQ